MRRHRERMPASRREDVMVAIEIREESWYCRDVLESLPWLDEKWASAGLLFAGSITAAMLLELLVRRTLLRIVGETESTLDDQLVAVFRRPIVISVLLVGGFYGGRTLLAADAFSQLEAGVDTSLIVIWAAALLRCGEMLIQLASEEDSPPRWFRREFVPLADLVLRIVVVGIAVYFSCLAWDIDVTAWLASAGIVGIAVGFAAKDTLANLFSGVFILVDRPYTVDDWVVFTDEQIRGKVTQIGFRSTRVLTRDEVEITVPNAVIGASKIINESGGPSTHQRIHVKVEAAYGADVEEVRRVLLACPDEVECVLKDRAPQVRFREFGASGLVFELLAWIDDAEQQGTAIDRLNVVVYQRFNEHGIEIPYSKHDVYVKELPAGLKSQL